MVADYHKDGIGSGTLWNVLNKFPNPCVVCCLSTPLRTVKSKFDATIYEEDNGM